jgi:hypothetical protein
VDERLLGKAKHRWFSDQWPHIARFIRAPDSTGWVEDKFPRWSLYAEELSPAERAAAYEEWADFFQWRLAQRATELARDRDKRHLVEEWTDSMTYCCLRSAAWARGEDPGEWVSQSQRRPDLHAEKMAIVAEISARPHPTSVAGTR